LSVAPDIGKYPYEAFVRDIETIAKNSRIMDKIIVLGDFNLPKVAWLKFEDFDLTLTGIFTDLEAELIDGLIDCNMKQLNSIPNHNGFF
jgi:hypothetical protein